jgi:hypothetical protein
MSTIRRNARDAFLDKVDEYRLALARAFRSCNHDLNGDALIDATRRILYRLVVMRFLEDKRIEPSRFVEHFGKLGTAWQDFVAASRRLDRSYSGIVFQKHEILDSPDFSLDDAAFAGICDDLSRNDTICNFNRIPIDLLGSIHERFLGSAIVGSGKKLRIEKKHERRKADGVYYTPDHVVRYIVESTVGKQIAGKSPEKIAEMRFADIACGGGTFLLATYDLLLRHHEAHYHAHPRKAQNAGCVKTDGVQRLSFEKKREILLNNIYGVDIDPQAVEVARLSLCLKLLEGETITSDGESQQESRAALLPSLNKNIVCGNSLMQPDFDQRKQLGRIGDNDHINDFDWRGRFREVFERGGFDAVVGNPPYIDSEWMTARLPETRKYCIRRYKAASGNWDMFCVFVERALQLCKAGGLSSYIVPNKLASADYAAGARRVLALDNRLLSVRDYSQVPVFPVAVYPMVYVASREPPDRDAAEVVCEKMRASNGGAIECELARSLPYDRFFSRPESTWEIFNASGDDALIERLREFPRLGEVANVHGAATVAEAYEIKSLIREAKPSDEGAIRIVNSGTIDRYDNLWGRKPCRYLGAKFMRPVIARSKLHALPRKRLLQAQTPKVIVAGMTRRLEAIADLGGTILAGKSTTVVESSHDPRLILALLNSTLANRFYNATFGGNKLAGGYLRIGPPQIQTIPVPRAAALASVEAQAIIEAVQQILDSFARLHATTNEPKKTAIQRQIDNLDRQIDRMVYAMYGLTEHEPECSDPTP